MFDDIIDRKQQAINISKRILYVADKISMVCIHFLLFYQWIKDCVLSCFKINILHAAAFKSIVKEVIHT